jgi:hypothetical protein
MRFPWLPLLPFLALVSFCVIGITHAPTAISRLNCVGFLVLLCNGLGLLWCQYPRRVALSFLSGIAADDMRETLRSTGFLALCLLSFYTPLFVPLLTLVAILYHQLATKRCFLFFLAPNF